MSVYYQTFVLYGYRFQEYDEFEEAVVGENEYSLFDCAFHDEYGYDRWDDDAEEGDIVMIADGRSGEYVYFGELRGKSEAIEGRSPNFDPQALEAPTFASANRIKQLLAEYRIEAGQPKYHVFTHVT